MLFYADPQVLQDQRGSVCGGDELLVGDALTPGSHGIEDIAQRFIQWRQLVHDPRRDLSIDRPSDDPVRLEAPEAVGQRMRTDTLQSIAQFAKSARPLQLFAHDQRGPRSVNRRVMPRADDSIAAADEDALRLPLRRPLVVDAVGYRCDRSRRNGADSVVRALP